MIDELDLALVDALRVDPRAPWSRLAAPLGVDPATLSRRWSRLTADGNAWVTCYPNADRIGRGLTALVQVDCPADRIGRVAAEIARHPQTASIELVTGDADLLLTVAAYDHASLTGYLLDRLGTVPGVLRTRTALVERTLVEGSSFSNGALDAEQRRAIAAPPPDGGRPGSGGHRVEEDLALIQALGADGRMPYAALAARTGLPASTVRRRLAELRDSGRAVLRCDASPLVTGHPVGAMLWLDVPPAALPDTARRLTALPQTRMCAVTVGPANLALYLVTPQLPDLRRIEQDLAHHHPAIRVHNRHITLRTLKLVGHLLTPDGRRTAYVPIEP
ncbi:Lrp/AsnC family transcriptional regulator [Kitasatospora sp. NPDC088391]|uniref:Lrp/AsnC family transcriptional regulator n=1 Tax=Kitasatospora sp. NPDC088391 TaxID=3364074 RepID=UPI00382E6B27